LEKQSSLMTQPQPAAEATDHLSSATQGETPREQSIKCAATVVSADATNAALVGWQQGDEQSVHAVFEVYYPRAVRLALLSGLVPDAAHDCAQEAFLRAREKTSHRLPPQNGEESLPESGVGNMRSRGDAPARWAIPTRIGGYVRRRAGGGGGHLAEELAARAGVFLAGAKALVAIMSLALKLDGRMGDVIGTAEHIYQPVEDARAHADRHIFDYGMTRKRQHATGDRPDVQVVDIQHSRDVAHIVGELGRLEALGGRFEQDVERLADDFDSAKRDHEGDQHAQYGVNPEGSGQRDHARADHHSQRGRNIPNNM